MCSGFKLLDAETDEWIRREPRRLDEEPIGITSDRSLIATLAGPDAKPPLTRLVFGRDTKTLEVVERLEVRPARPSPRVLRGLAQARLERKDTDPDLPDDAWFGWDVVRRVAGGDFITANNYDGNDYVIDFSKRPWRVLQAFPENVLAWSMDRQLMVTADVEVPARLLLHRASAAEGMKESLGWIDEPADMKRVNEAAFSPDGRWLAFASNDPTVHVFSIDQMTT